MTKLGLQPGVHGDEHEEKKDEKEQIKIDPKVFTVLQPTVIPMPAHPASSKSATNWSAILCKSLIVFVLFTCCAAALLILVNVTDMYFFNQSRQVGDKPQMEALISVNGNGFKSLDGSSAGSSEKSNNNNDQEGVVSIPLARVMVVEDISTNNESAGDDKKKTFIVDGSVEDGRNREMGGEQPQQRPLHPDEIEMIRNEQMRHAFQQQQQQEMEERFMQQQQQMMALRMWRMRRIQQAAFQQQQMMKMAFIQHQQQQQQMAEESARQQWMERSRWEEEQNQRRQWEAQQAFAQQQQQQRAQAQQFWNQHQMAMQQQQEQQQHQQPQFFQHPQPQWQSRPSVWQQPPQHFFFPGPQRPQPQPSQQQFPQPAEFIQPAPIPSVHDKIYEELQKKSQNAPINAPSRQIWTAITPTPAAPEVAETVTTPAPTTAAPDAAEVSDTILRDIFSAFDEQKNSEAATKELAEQQATTSTTEEPEMEGKGAIVIEDRFPRIEDRTTTPEPEPEESDEVEDDRDHEKELDPFAAVLKFFENGQQTQPEVNVSGGEDQEDHKNPEVEEEPMTTESTLRKRK